MTAKNTEFARVGKPRHGELCYLQIPAPEIASSVTFYEKIFGWQVEPEFVNGDETDRSCDCFSLGRILFVADVVMAWFALRRSGQAV